MSTATRAAPGQYRPTRYRTHSARWAHFAATIRHSCSGSQTVTRFSLTRITYGDLASRIGVFAPGRPRRTVRVLDRAALAAGAAPDVADPPEPFTTKLAIETAKAHRANRDVMRHRSQYPAPPVTRQCIACGVVAECDPALPCGVCNASPFHLIPLAPTSPSR